MKLFEDRLLVEGLRATEGDALTLSAGIKVKENKTFESLLVERAKNHQQCSSIEALFAHFNKATSNLFWLLSSFIFILGVVAVRNVLFADPFVSVNFFWAFALFFIPNIAMLIIWLLFFLQPAVIQNSSLARFFLMLLKQFERFFNKNLTQQKDYQTLFLCYFNIHFGKALARHQLSKLTHLLWLCYFTGATLMSIIMLATHQVDFIWQTSILSSQAFQTLTNLLAYLPQQLGVSVPSVEQIQQGNVLTENLLDAENRRLAWSSLLISSLFLYGLLPRLVLFLLMSKSLKKKKAGYNVDLSDAYYVRLRQILKPNKTVLGITDPDDQEIPVKHKKQTVHEFSERGLLTTEHYPIAIELSAQQFNFAQQHLQRQGSEAVGALINACDRQSQQLALSALANHKSHEVALYVSVSRLPDRGLKRFISELMAISSAQFKLFLIVENAHHQQRDNDWYQLAQNVGIRLDNIVHIEIGEIKHE